MKIHRIIILFFTLISCNLSAEKTYTDEEKQAFLKLWSTGKSLALIGDDEEINAEVEALMAQPYSDNIENNAYIYLMGLAEDSENPYQAGLAKYKSILNYKWPDLTSEVQEPRPKELHVPEIELMCNHVSELCFKVEPNKKQSEIFDQNHHKYLNTYLELFKHTHYQQVPQFIAENTYMQLKYVQFLQNYFHQQAVTQSIINNTQLIEYAIQEHHTLKQWLINSNQLFSRLLLTNLFNRNLNLLSYLLQTHKIEPMKIISEVHKFTPNAAAFTPTLLAEKARNYSNLKKYTDHLYAQFIGNKPITKIAQSTILKVFSKPNLSLNNNYSFIVKPLMTLDKLSPKQFKDAQQGLDLKVPEDKIRNAASGTHEFFINNSPRGYIKLKNAAFDLNTKIQLLSALAEQGSAEKVIDKAKQGQAAYLSHYDDSIPFMDQGKLCYGGINESNNRHICLEIIEN